MRSSPLNGPSPIDPISKPRPAATTPLIAMRPARIPTIDRPKIETISSSGDLNRSTTGRATRIKMVKKAAPTKPPKREDANAAESARAACPRLAIGNPSRTVACEAEEPGIPISIEANVSDVGTTAIIPIISARPRVGSIPNMKGSNSDKPAMPPRPGNTPMAKPMQTPKTRYPITIGCKICAQADPRAGSASIKMSIKAPSHCFEKTPPHCEGAHLKQSAYFNSTPN